MNLKLDFYGSLPCLSRATRFFPKGSLKVPGKCGFYAYNLKAVWTFIIVPFIFQFLSLFARSIFFILKVFFGVYLNF